MSSRDPQLRATAIRLVLAVASCLAATDAFSQSSLTLFDVPAGLARPAAVRDNPYALRSRVVSMRLERLGPPMAGPATSAPTLVINLFDDVVLSPEWERIEQDALGFTTWTGRVAGDPLSTLTLTRRDVTVSGQVSTGGRTFQIQSIGGGLYQVDEIDLQRLPGEHAPVLTQDQVPPFAAPSSTLAGPRGAPVADILVFYTPALQSRLGDPIARIAQAVSDTNTALARSQVDGSIRLVGIEALPFVEGTDLQDDLTAFASNPTVLARRNAVGADLVALITNAPYGNYCGVAFLGPSPSAAFSVVPEPCFNQYSFTHEVGHNLGGGHAPEDGTGSGWKTYSYAYKSPSTSPRFRTVLAYDCESVTCPRILNFSSATVRHQTLATGNSGQDNARTIAEALPLVEDFKPIVPTEPPSAPRNPRALTSGTLVFLSWQIPATGAVTNYRVLAGSSSGAVNLLNAPVGNVLALTTPAAPGTYYVRIVAENSAGSSPASEELVITVGGNDAIPGPPRGLAAQVYGSTVQLTWSPPNVGPAPASYLLEVGSAPGAADIGMYPSGGPYFYQGGVPDGLYYVRVRSQGGGTISAASSEVSFRVGPAPGCEAPDAPSSLFYSRSGNLVSLFWTAPSSALPLSYAIEAGTDAGLANLFNGSVGSTTTASAAVASGPYFIRVRATSACGTSAASNEVFIQVP